MLDFVIFAAVVIVCLIASIIYLYPGSKRVTTVPGPEPIDILEGNIPDIIACGSLHEFLCKIHEDYGPIVSFWLGPTLCISIGSCTLFQEQTNAFDRACVLFDAMKILMTDEAIHLTNGVEGRRRHAVYSKCFTLPAVNEYYSVCKQESTRVLDIWRKFPQDEYIPLMKHTYEYSIRTVLFALFGFQCDDDDDRVKTMQASFDVCFNEIERQVKGDGGHDVGSDSSKRFELQKENLHRIILEVVEKRRNSPSSGGNCSVVDAALSLDIPESTIYADLVTIMAAGFHKTASLATWAVYLLAMNPDTQERARQEVLQVCGEVGDITSETVSRMTYLAQVIKETLRWAIVAPFAARTQENDTELGGHVIPAGTPVVHELGIALNDPDIFEDPEVFDPDRFSEENMKKLPPYAFEPFGFSGKRQCFGYQFSLANVSVLLAVLLRSGLQLELAPDQFVTPKFDFTSKPSDEVWIALEKSE